MLVNFDGFRCGAACKNIIHKLTIHVLFNQKKHESLMLSKLLNYTLRKSWVLQPF